MTMIFIHIGLMTLLTSGCVDTPSKNPTHEGLQFSGRFLEANTCPHKLVVDVLLKGESEPIDIPDVAPTGEFIIHIAADYQETPLHIQGFCYASDEDFSMNSSAWQTEPLSITASYLENNTLELSRNRNKPEPAIQETIPTEWSTLAAHPEWVQFYGLRHPDNSDRTAGTMPEIRNGGLTTATHCTHIKALFAKIKQATSTELQPLLLPPYSTIEDACSSKNPMDLQIQIVQLHLASSCQALNLRCPSVSTLRMQSWIPNNKAFVSGEIDVIERAQLWLLFQHLVMLSRQQGLDSREFVPDLQSTDWKKQCQKVQDAYQNLKMAIPTSHQSWLKDCITAE